MFEKHKIASLLAQGVSYGTSLFSFAAGISDLVTILSGVAGAILTISIAYGNFKIKAAEARMKNAQAETIEIENAKKSAR